jgi:hypothetical protein
MLKMVELNTDSAGALGNTVEYARYQLEVFDYLLQAGVGGCDHQVPEWLAVTFSTVLAGVKAQLCNVGAEAEQFFNGLAGWFCPSDM